MLDVRSLDGENGRGDCNSCHGNRMNDVLFDNRTDNQNQRDQHEGRLSKGTRVSSVLHNRLANDEYRECDGNRDGRLDSCSGCNNHDNHHGNNHDSRDHDDSLVVTQVRDVDDDYQFCHLYYRHRHVFLRLG